MIKVDIVNEVSKIADITKVWTSPDGLHDFVDGYLDDQGGEAGLTKAQRQPLADAICVCTR